MFKKMKIIMFISLFFILINQAMGNQMNNNSGNNINDIEIIIDNNTKIKLNSLINDMKAGKNIVDISSSFLGVPYQGNTLIGNQNTKEKLVVNFSGVDCFTFLDYLASLRLSNSYNDFINNLIKVRYINGKIDYLYRRHFFTDWANEYPYLVKDITREVSDNYQTKIKILNLKNDNSNYLDGIPTKEREINYIPSKDIDLDVLKKLKDGDYIGIYTDKDGLDVTHTGIYLNNENNPILRHASSIYKKVVDQPFLEYVKKYPGIIVLRAIDN